MSRLRELEHAISMLPDVRADGRAAAIATVLEVLDIDCTSKFRGAMKRATTRCASCKCKHVVTVSEQVDCIWKCYAHNIGADARRLPGIVMTCQPVLRYIAITGTVNF